MPARRVRRGKSPKKCSKWSTQKRAALVRGDMLRNPSLSLTKAARKRKIDPRSVLKHFPADFQKNSSRQFKVRPNDRSRQTLYIPGLEPGEEIAVPTKSARERRLLGRWMGALKAAGRGDFSKMKKFPRDLVIGGVHLPTARADIQRILNSLAEAESPFEGLYRTIARPS